MLIWPSILALVEVWLAILTTTEMDFTPFLPSKPFLNYVFDTTNKWCNIKKQLNSILLCVCNIAAEQDLNFLVPTPHN